MDGSFMDGDFMARPDAGEMAVLRLLGSLVMLFFIGGVVGALGFKHVGFLFTLPLAAILLILAAMPVIEDMRRLSAAGAKPA